MDFCFEECLASLEVRLDAISISELTDLPLQTPPAREAVVHYITRGEGTIETEGGRIPVAAGTMIVVPRYTGARIIAAASADEPRRARQCDAQLSGWTGKMNRDLVIASSTVQVTVNGGINLFDQLAEPLSETTFNAESLNAIFKVVGEELAQPRLGSRIVIEAMVKQSMVLLLRSHLERLGIASPLYLPMVNPKLRGCIQAITENPHAPHSVSSLARLAGMSESRFTARFTESYGKTPMKFVQSVRLRDAATLLRTSDLPLKVIAARVGYLSRSHLSRVFQAQFGTDPTTYRLGKRQVAGLFEPSSAEPVV